MRRLLCIFSVAFAALMLPFPGGWAGEVASPEPQASKRPESTLVRQESLEIPGVTACHQCEWRPKPHTMAAAEQCGMTPDGAPKAGIFECGFSQECDRVCEFVRCAN